MDLITADENAEEEGEEREVEVGGGGLVQGEERQRWFNKRREEEKGEQEGNGKLSPVRSGSTCVVMEKFRPKRPTTLALFPQLPQAGTQVGRLGGSLDF